MEFKEIRKRNIKINIGDYEIGSIYKKDVPFMLDWIRDESLFKYWGQKIKDYELNQELFWDKCNNDDNLRLGIRSLKTDLIIGEIVLYDYENDNATIGYRLGKAYQGNHIMTRAITNFCNYIIENKLLNSLKAMVDVSNIPSNKIMEDANFEIVSKIVQGKMIESICDYYIYERK